MFLKDIIFQDAKKLVFATATLYSVSSAMLVAGEKTASIHGLSNQDQDTVLTRDIAFDVSGALWAVRSCRNGDAPSISSCKDGEWTSVSPSSFMDELSKFRYGVSFYNGPSGRLFFNVAGEAQFASSGYASYRKTSMYELVEKKWGAVDGNYPSNTITDIGADQAVVMSNGTWAQISGFFDDSVVVVNGMERTFFSPLEDVARPESNIGWPLSLCSDDLSGAWIWEYAGFDDYRYFSYFNGQKWSVLDIDQGDDMLMGCQVINPLVGGGLAVFKRCFPSGNDSIIYLKGGAVAKKVPIYCQAPCYVDSLDGLWFYDSLKVWVWRNNVSDTVRLSSVGLGFVKKLVVSRDASKAAILCDSGVAVITPNLNKAPIRVTPRQSFIPRTSCNQPYFSLSGKRLGSLPGRVSGLVVNRGGKRVGLGEMRKR